MSLAIPPAPEMEPDVHYPSGDGQPMAETPLHVRAIMLLFQALEDALAAQADVYIAANMFWYWEKGNPGARRAPDVMVVKGVGRAERRSFFTWRENGAVPSVTFEVASEGKWRADLYEKSRLYARLGVREYFVFDPEARHVRPPLQGFRRNDQGVFVPIEPDAEDRLYSEELGLFLRAEGGMLRLIDPATGKPIPTREERIEHERQRAEQLEAEVARLRALLGQRPEDPHRPPQ